MSDRHAVSFTFDWADGVPSDINLAQVGPVLDNEDLATLLTYLADNVGTLTQHHFKAGPPHPGYAPVR